MKNIHIIPTSQPSRFFIYNGELGLAKGYQYGSDAIQNKNIYITSDEEIKEGDYFIALDGSNDIYKANKVWLDIIKENPNPSQKIILTTDPDLIKNGVQAIDDEFLEWFVKNPRCEFVNIVPFDGYNAIKGKYFGYEIIIPKEKQTKCYCGHTTYCDCGPEEPKQDALNHFLSTSSVIVKDPQTNKFIMKETLEEAAENYNLNTINSFGDYQSFIDGAKWQQERSYSEEEVLDITKQAYSMGISNYTIKAFNELFEINKKK